MIQLEQEHAILQKKENLTKPNTEPPSTNNSETGTPHSTHERKHLSAAACNDVTGGSRGVKTGDALGDDAVYKSGDDKGDVVGDDTGEEVGEDRSKMGGATGFRDSRNRPRTSDVLSCNTCLASIFFFCTILPLSSSSGRAPRMESATWQFVGGRGCLVRLTTSGRNAGHCEGTMRTPAAATQEHILAETVLRPCSAARGSAQSACSLFMRSRLIAPLRSDASDSL